MGGVLAALILTLLALATSCGPRLPEDLSLRAAVAAKAFSIGASPAEAGLRFQRPPEAFPMTYDGEKRPIVLTAVDPWWWTGRIPERAELHIGAQILPEAWTVIRSFRAWVTVRAGDEREVLEAIFTPRRKWRRDWLDTTVDLSRWAGREVTLEFAASLENLPAEHRHSNLIAWSPVRLSSASDRPEQPPKPPNILFILVDTLRADHLTSYGYGRPTSPQIEQLLARPGTVVEEAHSQAPWTLPSVVSFMTGRHPGEVLGSDSRSYGIPAGIKSLAEEMEGLGYETGAFIANRTLHTGNGFDRGFHTFFTPPPMPSIQPNAEQLTGRAQRWLRAHARSKAPFFGYVHYIDPHDPYENPDTGGKRSPFFPNYQGKLTGIDVHGVYSGKIPLGDPEQDVAQLTALYDSEIVYTDRWVGELIRSLPQEILDDTLIVLTADHGEELYDHGGWKHGFTLYEEEIHVPLLMRWDGHIPAGKRLRGTVRLLDLLPTLVRAGGGKAAPEWDGIDLMPALEGKSSLPRLAAFAQHMMIGPLRAAAVLDRKKLILFNPETPYTPHDPLQAYLWSLDLERMHRAELYDLDADPREKANLADRAPGQVDALQPFIHRQLDAQLPGLRVIASGLPAGARLTGSLVLDRPAAGWASYFLAEGDRVEIDGNRMRFDLGGETLSKGFLVGEGFARLESVEARLGGTPLPAGRLLLGPGTPYGGGAVDARSLREKGWQPPPSGLSLRIWLPPVDRKPVASAAPNTETEERLRALGYIQ